MSKNKPAQEKPKPITEQEMAVKHNHKELVNQLNAHFNGNTKEQKNALKNVENTYDSLVKSNKTIKAE